MGTDDALEELLREVQPLQDRLVGLRRRFAMQPELSGEEAQTAATIAAARPSPARQCFTIRFTLQFSRRIARQREALSVSDRQGLKSTRPGFAGDMAAKLRR